MNSIDVKPKPRNSSRSNTVHRHPPISNLMIRLIFTTQYLLLWFSYCNLGYNQENLHRNMHSQKHVICIFFSVLDLVFYLVSPGIYAFTLNGGLCSFMDFANYDSSFQRSMLSIKSWPQHVVNKYQPVFFFSFDKLIKTERLVVIIWYFLISFMIQHFKT